MRLRRKKSEAPKRQHGGHEILSFVVIIALALVLAWVIISFIFESYQVDGVSMENTLHNNDRLIVWKAPVTWAHLTGGQWVPGRGDIIIFKEPGLAAYGDANVKDLVKRVIGLPGDKLVIKNGHVTIYDKQHPNGFTNPINFDGKAGHSYTSGKETVQLNSHQIFVMGDNRPDSLDSRIFGPVNLNQVIGKLILRDWPISDMKAF